MLGADFRKFRAKPAAPAPTLPVPTPPPTPAPSASPSGSPGGGPAIKPDRFFESLVCRVSDHPIAAVVGEINVSPETYPISATYLLRTLVELCLRRLIAASGKKIGGARDASLTDVVNFELNNRDISPFATDG